jgi:hypothetical protein
MKLSVLTFSGLILAATAVSFYIAPMPDADQIAPAVYATTLTAPRYSAPQPVTAPETLPPATTTPPSCEAFVSLAYTLGWPAEELDTLATIMRRESACQPDAIGDWTRGGSFGLMQLHVPTWCLRSKYWPEGWLSVHGSVGPDNCTGLLDPATNLAAALLIQREGGWSQWTTWRP